MTIDLAKLRTLAIQASSSGSSSWALGTGYEQSVPGLYVYNATGLGLVVASEDHLREECAPFIAAANPEVVLALIDEIERLEAERDARPAITPETAAAWKDNDTRAVGVVIHALHAHATKAVPR